MKPPPKELFAACALSPERPVLSLKTDSFGIRLLKDLERTPGFENAILRGSALYQPAIAAMHGFALPTQPKDYDVLVNFGRYDEFRRTQARTRGMSPSSPLILLDYLNCHPILTNIDFKFARAPDRDGLYYINITGLYKKRPVDIIVQNLPHTLDSVATQNDAPITGIAMDSNGNIRTHPSFCDHAARLIYDPPAHLDIQTRAQRFETLSAKFPGLRRMDDPAGPGYALRPVPALF